MPPIVTDPAGAAAVDLAVALDGLVRRVEGVVLPHHDLDGWASLCAGEYRDAVGRLAADLVDVESELRTARRVLGS